MSRKRFVSIVFTGKKLLTLVLTPQKTKVERFGFADIPSGVIAQHAVQDVDTLAELIKSTFKRLSIKEKSVGIVIPEFSTYTKLLKIPHLPKEDLDEAVRWQSQEFLPSDAEMNLDWEIISQTENEYSVLTVSVPMKVLSGYVEAVSVAGLMPLVVETPSLSITRVADGDDKTRVLIYVSADETVLVITQGDTILASSVASSTSVNEIIQTAGRMVSHFSDKPASEIKIGGVNLSSQFIDSLSKSLNLPISKIEAKVEGMTDLEIQENLIGISLQKKDTAQPESEFTINLLPPVWAKHYKNQIRDQSIWTLTQAVSVGIWTCFLSVFIIYILLSSQLADLKEKSIASASGASTESLNEIKKINDLTSRITKINDLRKDPVKVVNLLAQAKPQGVRISGYKYNVETGEIKILGRADTRDLLINYKQALEKVEGVSQVTLPISAIVSEANIDFEIHLGYQVQKAQSQIKLKQ